MIHLAEHNPAHLIFTGRNPESAESTLSRCRAVGPSVPVTFIPCDLADMSSVKSAADTVLNMGLPRIDALVCNAGIMAKPAGLSVDGYEIHFATNHLGHALLTRKLLPLIRGGGGRVVVVTSAAWRGTNSKGIAFDRLRTPQDMAVLGRWVRYCQSKLANMIYARELAARYPDVLSFSITPGVVSTGLVTDLGPVDKVLVYIPNVGRIKTPEEGTHNLLWAVVAPEESVKRSGYYEPVGVLSTMKSAASKNPELGAKLWDWTEGELQRWL